MTLIKHFCFKPILIKEHGYPVETHTVQTEDGYILTMYRIPYGKNQDAGSKRGPPVFCLHGLGENSVVWVMLNNQSLGKYNKLYKVDSGFRVVNFVDFWPLNDSRTALLNQILTNGLTTKVSCSVSGYSWFPTASFLRRTPLTGNPVSMVKKITT